MFGDEMLIGNYEVTVDNAFRIFLPSKTGREKGDHLALIYDGYIECYRIYDAFMLKENFEHLKKLILSAKSDEERIKFIKLHEEFCQSILKSCKVDSQGRILLGNKFECGEQLTLIGANDHLILKRKK